MENLHVKLESLSDNELIIRAGQALPLVPPNKINISGDIDTIANFLSIRNVDGGGHSTQAVDKTKVMVVVDKQAMTIKLDLDPENPFGASFTGKMELSDELKAFQINQTTTFTREQLIKLIRFNRQRFADTDKQTSLLAAYQTFNAQAFIDMSAANDTRGNKSSSYNKEVKTGLPEEFILKMPIFKGQGIETFRVEICLDVTDGGARFWFESVELAELIEQRRDEIFDGQLEHCAGFVVIYK